jgi:5-methylcytosine-specific restriction endonuclease McrA
VQAAGALFLPASFSVLGAWGPAIQSLFDTLWQEKIQKAEDSGDPTWPIVQRKLAWRSKISVTLMRANAQMVLSRARQQGTLCPAHAHRANISHHASHRNPVQHPHDRRNLANSRSLCVARRGASARGV